MKRLLILSYGFPPVNMIGVVRIAKFVKYLARDGWESLVITPRDLPYYPKDSALVEELPASTRVFPTPYAEPQLLIPASTRARALKKSYSASAAISNRGMAAAGRAFRAATRFLFLPDEMALWPRLAWRTAANVVRTFSPHAMLSTSPPASAHLLALRLKRRFNLPWVADFRDEWTKNPFTRYPTPLHRRLNAKIERTVLESCDRLTSISEPLVESFREMLPTSHRSKCSVLYNGYDAEDFEGPPASSPERFTITYAGNFYGHRQPTTFFQALERSLRTGAIPAADCRVVFAGTNVFHHPPSVNMEVVTSVLELQSTLPHRKAVNLMRTSSVLLLVISPESGRGSLTGKIFEYLASGRPILALVPPGVAAEVIRRTKAGVVVDPNDVSETQRAIEMFYTQWRTRRLPTRSPHPEIAGYSRAAQTEHLLSLLQAITNERNPR